MLVSEIGPETLYNELNKYLSQSRLSLSQVAKVLGVSKGHLSEIKNGKAQPALNTGLRILKLCGLELEQRKAWAHFYNGTISEEYLEVHDKVEKENEKKLTEKVSFLLAKDLDLMNAYVDIVNQEDIGLPLVDLRFEYGKTIERKLEKLVAQDILTLERTDLGKVYKSGKVDPIITKNASYDLLKQLVEDQQVKYQSGEKTGQFKFHINDIDDDGYEKLSELVSETMTKAGKIFEEHKTKRTKGGKRYAFEVLLGSLKTILLASTIMFALPSFNGDIYAQSGGLTGGSSEDQNIGQLPWHIVNQIDDIKINWPEVNMSGTYVKVNSICRTGNSGIIQTIAPVEVCMRTELVRHVCTITAGVEGQECVIDNSEVPYENLNDGTTLTQTVDIRTCVDKENQFLELDPNHSGMFVRFNNVDTGEVENTQTLLSEQIREGDFSFQIPLYKVVEDEEAGLHSLSITKKDYTIPFCL